MIADLARQGALGEFPHLFGVVPVLLLFHHHVRRQPVGEGTDLPGRAAGRGLAGEGEGPVARLGDLAGEQVDVVHEAVDPDPAHVLIEAHGPVRDHLLLGIGVELRQALQALHRHPGQLGHILGGVGLQGLLVLLEADLGQVALGRVLGRLLQGVVRAQAVTDVCGRGIEVDVGVDEVPVHLVIADDVVGDVVEDRQVGLGLEDDAVVRQLEAAVLEGGEDMDLAAILGQAGVGEARPEHRVVLRHVRPPEDEGVGLLQVVIAAHGLVGAKGAHEADHGGGHAVTGVGVDIVRAKAGLVELGRGIALVDGPLAGAEHAHPRGDLLRWLALVLLQALLDGRLPFLRHEVEGLVPGYRLELALLVVLAVLLAQQGLGQPVLAIHDLGQEVALDAVQPTVDRGVRIALGRHHPPILGAHQYRATRAAEAAGGLVPADVLVLLLRRCGRHAW